MFLDKIFKKKMKKAIIPKSVMMENDCSKTKVIGQDTPFTYLNEQTKEFKQCKFLRIFREVNGERYWESVKPYEIIDGNLCVRSKSDIPHMTGWIVLSKDDVADILSRM